MKQSRDCQKNTFRILNKLFCTSGPNLVILAWAVDELLCRQTQSSDLGIISLWRSKSIAPRTIKILTKLFCTFGPNFVILAWMAQEFSHGQARDWHTDGQMDTQTQAMTIPEGPNWPIFFYLFFVIIDPLKKLEAEKSKFYLHNFFGNIVGHILAQHWISTAHYVSSGAKNCETEILNFKGFIKNYDNFTAI